MYELKILTPKFQLPEVNCIFKVKKIGQSTQGLCNSEEKKIQLATSATAQTSMIVERQLKVIQQLEALQAKLVSIREKCKLSAPTPTPVVCKATSMPCEDFVVNVHPNQVPYTLLALRNFWQNIINVDIKVYKHSSVAKLGKEAQYFEKQLAAHTINKSLPSINITLIWMECEQTEMRSQEGCYFPIYGEVNILRYLSRLGKHNLQYEDLNSANEIDTLLDISHQVLRLRTPAARRDLLAAIATRLGNEFLFEQQLTLADIVVYCTIKQAVPAKDLNFPSKELNTQFKDWRSRVQNLLAV